MIRTLFFVFLSFDLLSANRVILDTDPSYDPDDVGCMAMLHTMANQGVCEIIGIVNSTNHKESPLAISAINSFYNRSGIPVGDYKGYLSKIDAPETNYDHYLVTHYDRELEMWTESLDSVALYRELLASADDNSVTVVIIGTMHNFHDLLKSKPCKFSDKNGTQLVEEKVKLVGTMGGNFIDGKGLDRTNWGGSAELCKYTEWSCLNPERNRMCRYVIENCTAPFIASGWEVGCGDYYHANYGTVFTGQGLKDLHEQHIVRRAYEYHFENRGGADSIKRHSNDQCALHFAILGESDNYKATRGGKITLTDHGECSWEKHGVLDQGYIQKNRGIEALASEIEALMMGVVQDPDFTPPSVPANLKYENGRLSWDASVDDTQGSWVVGYEVFKDDQFLGTAYGLQYILSGQGHAGEYTVKAINTNQIKSGCSPRIRL